VLAQRVEDRDLWDVRCPHDRKMPVRVPISFKDALVRFLDECTKAVPKGRVFDAADHSHLERWADDDRAEAVWQKVQSLPFGPIGSFELLEGFIPLVLVSRRIAESVKTTEETIERHRERRAVQPKLAEHLDSLVTVWNSMVLGDNSRSQFALRRAQAHKEEARAWRKLSQKPLPHRPFTISRVDRNGSRKQRAFMEMIGREDRPCGPLSGI
jgi:hypothetical protein